MIYVTMLTTYLDSGSNTWEISAWLPPGCCRHGVSVHCTTLVSWYVASMLCCHCWMFSLSDALPMQSYPSRVWFLCVAVQICVRDNLFPTDLFFRMKSVVYVSWLTLWSCSLHSCRMFVLTVEYGLVHRGDCMNCETLYFSFDPAFVWPDLGAQTDDDELMLNVLRCHLTY